MTVYDAACIVLAEALEARLSTRDARRRGNLGTEPVSSSCDRPRRGYRTVVFHLAGQPDPHTVLSDGVFLDRQRLDEHHAVCRPCGRDAASWAAARSLR